MRILQFIDVPWDSGLAHYALILSQELKRNGHQVFVSALPGEKPWVKAKRLGLKTVPLATLRGLNPLRRFLREHAIDVLNAHTGRTHSLAVASALGQKVAVVRTRSDARDVKPRVGSRFIYRHTQRVITAADYIRQSYLRSLGLSARQVVTIYQGISSSDFEVTAGPASPVIGIVARLDPVKGHRYLLEALALLKNAHPDLRLRIMGQEENVKERDLRTMAKNLGIDQQVEFAGYLKDVPAAMATCSLGVIASTGSEAVSRVALEWMAAGRPVVATRVGCLPEIVQAGRSGLLVDPRNAPALAQAIGYLLHHPAQALSMGKTGRTRVEDIFSLQDFSKRTEAVYAEALKECRCRN